MRTWLLVAAERREFDGLLKRFAAAGAVPRKMDWPRAKFAREVDWKGDRWRLIANGAGPGSVQRALSREMDVSGIISTGLAGAIDPALKLGDIVVSGEIAFSTGKPFVRGTIHSVDRVAVTAADKQEVRSAHHAAIVEMESAAVASKAAEWGTAFGAIRVVSDTAAEDLPMDFNKYRDRSGNFSRTGIALAAMARPFTVMPRLLAFDRNCRQAADVLGDFLADCRF